MPLPEEIVSTLPEEIRSERSLESFDSIGDMAKAYVSAKRMIGDAAVLRPPKDADETKMAEWRQAQLGKLKEFGFIESAPESPDKYEFKFDGVAPEVVNNDQVMQKARTIFHKLGLPNAKAQQLTEMLSKEVLPSLLPTPPEIIEGDAAKALLAGKFKSEMPLRLDNYKSAITTLKSTYPQIEDILKESLTFIDGKAISFFDHPAIVEFFSDYGAKMKQDFGGAFSVLSSGDTLDSVQAEINDIRNNPSNPWHKGFNSDDDQDPAKAHVDKLYKKKQALLTQQRRAS